MTKQWTMRREQNSAKAEILIYEDIGDGMFGGLSAKMFVEQLSALGAVEELDVRINSWGGFASEGIAMYNALHRHAALKNVYIDAMAASAATLPAMAASPGRLVIAPNARMMIHNAWNVSMGDKKAMLSEAARLEQLDGQLADMYAKRTGKTRAAVLKIMDAETWLTGDEAVKAGFADKVSNEPSAMAAPPRGRELSWIREPGEESPVELAAKEERERQATAIAVRMRLLELEAASE